MSLPILRVGVSALIAYCGTSETSVIRYGRIARLSAIGSSCPSSSTLPPRCLHPGVQVDQAVAERGLAAARLAGQAHDLPVGDGEADVVDRAVTSPARAAVGDREVLDR